MIRNSAIMALIMVCGLHFSALADTPVRIRSDGKIVDSTGKITAVQNPNDPRNTAYEKFYSNVGPDGKPDPNSDFYIVADANAGYMRKEIAPEAPKIPEKMTLQQLVKPSVTTPGLKKIQINSDPNVPLYDNMSGGNSVYGN